MGGKRAGRGSASGDRPGVGLVVGGEATETQLANLFAWAATRNEAIKHSLARLEAQYQQRTGRTPTVNPAPDDGPRSPGHPPRVGSAAPVELTTGLDAITLGSRFDHYGMTCPQESRSWWMLGYLFTSLVAMDPKSAKVYAFPEGSSGYVELHRDVESLVYALIEFRKLEVDHDNDADPEELVARFKQVVGAFDPTPFADEESPWSLSLEELEHGMW
ncbi:SUKH-4 family immunity protein [Streptomyces sp. NPDC008141]|uniref:SUKH-4 family immunity protein n=1 Tax=Streptomyces sp. NPDC008141 TaxID=3364815 RepID=UPI0036E8F303